jgi:hypothetical protein
MLGVLILWPALAHLLANLSGILRADREGVTQLRGDRVMTAHERPTGQREAGR